MLNCKKILLAISLIVSTMTYAGSEYTEILLIRHGQTDWNLENRVQGHSDIPLNATGIAQAEALGIQMGLHHSDVVLTFYSSDLQRAVVTAQKTAEVFQNSRLGTINIIQFPSLREYNWGEAEGILVTEKNELYQLAEEQLLEKYPDRNERWNYTAIPGSETFNDLVARTKEALTTIAKNHPGEKVAVFVHARLIGSLIADVENLQQNPSGLTNCAVVHFLYSHDSENPIKFIKIESLIQ